LSALAGALLVLAADTLARVAANPIEIPIGAVTALIGAPAFFVLLRRTRARQGGWA
jgi:iron complex transport system permease protein